MKPVVGEVVWVERKWAGHVLEVRGGEVVLLGPGCVQPGVVDTAACEPLYRYIRQPGQPGRYVVAVAKELARAMGAKEPRLVDPGETAVQQLHLS